MADRPPGDPVEVHAAQALAPMAVESPWVAWVEWTVPRWARVASIVLAMLLVARAGASAGLEAAVAGGLLGGVYTGVLCARRTRLGQVAIALTPCLALAWSGTAALGLSTPMAPFAAQGQGQAVLLLLRAIVLGLVALHARGGGAGRRALLGVVATLFVVSLAARGFVIAEVIAAALLVGTPARLVALPVSLRPRGAEVSDRASGRRPALVLVVGGMLSVLSLAWHHMAILGDGFGMIATGRFLLAHPGRPTSDPFSYASLGDHWTVVNGGACALFALVTRLGGLRALMVVGAAVEGLAVGLLWLWAARGPLSRVLLLPLALFFVQVDAEDLSARGQLFGDLGFVLLVIVLFRLREGKRSHPALVVLWAAVWTNLHTSFLVMLLVPLAMAALSQLDPKATRSRPGALLALSLLALLGTALNPYGPRYVWFSALLAFDPSAATFDLFQSPDFHDPAWLVAPAVGVALLVVRGFVGEGRFRRSEQGLLLLFVLAACTARRYATELVAVEILVMGALLDRVDFGKGGARRILRAAAVTTGVLAAGTALVASQETKDPLRDVPALAAVVGREAAREQESAGKRFHRVLNPLHWGGYLAYAWMGNPRYFIDGRDQIVLYGNGAYEDSQTLWSGGPGVGDVLDARDVGTVIWERGAPLDVILRQDGRWRLVHQDRIAVVHVRVQ